MFLIKFVFIKNFIYLYITIKHNQMEQKILELTNELQIIKIENIQLKDNLIKTKQELKVQKIICIFFMLGFIFKCLAAIM